MPKREAPSITLRRTKDGLAPASSYDAELLAAINPGAEVHVSIVRAERSWPQLKRYWALLHRVVEATGGKPYSTAERLHEAAKMACGVTTPIRRFGSHEFVFIPDSVAMDAMTQAEFNKFQDEALHLISVELLDGVPIEQWERSA